MDVYDYYVTPEEYELAAKNGISRNTVDWRIRGSGWRKQKAITKPPQVRKNWKELTKIAERYGISYELLKNRLHTGWDEWTAATKPKQTEFERNEAIRQVTKTNRKYPLEVVLQARRNGICESTFGDRMRYGWDITRAATLAPSTYNCVLRLKEIYGKNCLKNLNKRFFLKFKK